MNCILNIEKGLSNVYPYMYPWDRNDLIRAIRMPEAPVLQFLQPSDQNIHVLIPTIL